MAKSFLRNSQEKDSDYVKKNIWKKIKKVMSKVPFIPDVISMYYCAMDTNTPTHVKVIAFSTLAYFITPLDIIPDAILLTGYGDDAGVILTAMKSINPHITNEHKRKAKKWLESNV